MNVQERIQTWLDGPYDAKTKEELRRLLKEDPQSLEEAFFKDLSFGTGGMRALMGLGTNRLNIYTIRMATQGLAHWIKKKGGEKPSVFIGYDVRNHSREFAENAALVLSGNGILPLLSKEVCPAPLVSFACRHFKCAAAIMITASHNPPQYNGYKVYGADGCQVTFPADRQIMEEVAKIKSPEQVILGNRFEEVGSEIDTFYFAALKNLQMVPEGASEHLKIIYTNLHGTGSRLMQNALKSWGFTHFHYVEKQRPLDGNFTCAPSPNPEEPKALELGTEQLMREKGDLLIATDPDADRIGLVCPTLRFTGNQIACLCLNHICKTLFAKNQLPPKPACIKSIVTTELFRKIGEFYGVKCFDVLTGFKYIGEKIGEWEKNPSDYHYLFGAEESYGYLFGTFVRDKDAISSACLIVEMASVAKKEGKTLPQVLDEIYKTHGVFRERIANLTFADTQEGMDQMRGLMQRLRKTPPQEIGGQRVKRMDDFAKGFEGLPPSDVLRFWCVDGNQWVIRPSGTEPKVKIYLEGVGQKGQSPEEVDARLQRQMASFTFTLTG